jgi:hypothetical protein
MELYIDIYEIKKRLARKVCTRKEVEVEPVDHTRVHLIRDRSCSVARKRKEQADRSCRSHDLHTCLAFLNLTLFITFMYVRTPLFGLPIHLIYVRACPLVPVTDSLPMLSLCRSSTSFACITGVLATLLDHGWDPALGIYAPLTHVRTCVYVGALSLRVLLFFKVV